MGKRELHGLLLQSLFIVDNVGLQVVHFGSFLGQTVM